MPVETASTTIHTIQFSIFFRANNQVAMKLSDVVKESQYGKSESVYVSSTQAIMKKSRIDISNNLKISLPSVRVTPIFSL